MLSFIMVKLLHYEYLGNCYAYDLNAVYKAEAQIVMQN